MIGKLTNHNLIWSHVKNSSTIADKAINLQSMGSVKEAVKFVTIYNRKRKVTLQPSLTPMSTNLYYRELDFQV